MDFKEIMHLLESERSDHLYGHHSSAKIPVFTQPSKDTQALSHFASVDLRTYTSGIDTPLQTILHSQLLEGKAECTDSLSPLCDRFGTSVQSMEK